MCGELFDLLHLYRFKLLTVPSFFERAKEVVDEQGAIIDAIATRDAVSAEGRMREHLANNLRFHLDIMQRTALPG